MAHPPLGGGPALPPPPAPPLSLARVHRLLRPLRSALASLSTEIAYQHALDHAQPRPAPLPPRTRPRTVDPDWDSPPAKRQPRRRSSIAIGPQHHARHLSLAAALPTSDSSPFKLAARRRPPRPATTYGTSRRAPPPPPPTATPAPPPAPLDQPSPRRDVRLTPADLRARLAAPDAGLTNLALQQRAAAALRAYGTVLEAVSSPCAARDEARGPPSLAEVAARTLGWGIEDDLRAFGAHLLGAAASDDSDGEDGASVAMDRSASAQDVDLVAATAQDEWYESSTPHAVRCVPLPLALRRPDGTQLSLVRPLCSWMLGDHATAIVVNALDRADAPPVLWECCFDLCLAHAAHAEVRPLSLRAI